MNSYKDKRLIYCDICIYCDMRDQPLRWFYGNDINKLLIRHYEFNKLFNYQRHLDTRYHKNNVLSIPPF
jgi:hypothetical protein